MLEYELSITHASSCGRHKFMTASVMSLIQTERVAGWKRVMWYLTIDSHVLCWILFFFSYSFPMRCLLFMDHVNLTITICYSVFTFSISVSYPRHGLDNNMDDDAYRADASTMLYIYDTFAGQIALPLSASIPSWESKLALPNSRLSTLLCVLNLSFISHPVDGWGGLQKLHASPWRFGPGYAHGRRRCSGSCNRCLIQHSVLRGQRTATDTQINSTPIRYSMLIFPFNPF